MKITGAVGMFHWTPQSGVCDVCGRRRQAGNHDRCAKFRQKEALRLRELQRARKKAA